MYGINASSIKMTGRFGCDPAKDTLPPGPSLCFGSSASNGVTQAVVRNEIKSKKERYCGAIVLRVGSVTALVDFSPSHFLSVPLFTVGLTSNELRAV